MTDKPPRIFTLDQANATLPLVRRITDDLVTLHPRWRDAVTAYELAQDAAQAGAESDEARDARVVAGRLAGEIESCLDELGQIGCVFKGFETGLVDFAANYEGRVVHLCWRRGEDVISHWHEVVDGFDGRQPLDESFSTAGAS